MPENRQKGKVMKDKFKSLGKRIVALLLSLLTVTMMFPLSAFAATENLGAVSGMKKLDVSVSKHYGHEVHTTKKGGTTYPLFCIEYGTTSPSSSYLKGKKAMASDMAIKAAKWIFAGYYLEHGNSIDWQDMAYCQKNAFLQQHQEQRLRLCHYVARPVRQDTAVAGVAAAHPASGA